MSESDPNPLQRVSTPLVRLLEERCDSFVDPDPTLYNRMLRIAILASDLKWAISKVRGEKVDPEVTAALDGVAKLL